jgi:hypothetical protein
MKLNIKKLFLIINTLLFIFLIYFFIYTFLNDNTIEGLATNPSDAFCANYRGSGGKLDSACQKLTKNNCNSTSCCVWTSENKCAAGNANGPIFNSDSNGKTKQLGYYFFQNKCYGEKCKQNVMKNIVKKQNEIQ